MFGRDQYARRFDSRRDGLAAASTTSTYRTRLFNRSLEALGLTGSIEAVVRDGRLVLDVRMRAFFFPRKLAFGPSTTTLAITTCPSRLSSLDGSNFYC